MGTTTTETFMCVYIYIVYIWCLSLAFPLDVLYMHLYEHISVCLYLCILLSQLAGWGRWWRKFYRPLSLIGLTPEGGKKKKLIWDLCQCPSTSIYIIHLGSKKMTVRWVLELSEHSKPEWDRTPFITWSLYTPSSTEVV